MHPYWHIVLPIELILEDKPEMQTVFDQNYKDDFVFEKKVEFELVRNLNLDGKKIHFQQAENRYFLSKEILKDEFLAFYRFFLTEFQRLYQDKQDKFEAHVFEKDLLEDFLRKMEDLNCRGFHPHCREAVEKIDSNYFLHFDTLRPDNVEEGYPLPYYYNSNLQVVCLLHSYEPMNQSLRETLIFHNFVEHIKKASIGKFKLAKYLFTAGY